MINPYKIVTIAIILFLPPPFDSFSQSSVTDFSEVFSNIDSTRVTTGYLLDKAVEYASLVDYDGVIRNDNYSDIVALRNTIATINSARINSVGQYYDVSNLINSLADTSAVQIGIATFKYNYIVSNALSSNLISYQDEKVYDVYMNGIWQNPYAEKRVFVFATSLPGFNGTTVRFKFSSSHLWGNINPIVTEFDAGDGNGYVIINGSYDSLISYSSVGEKTLRMRITLSDNTTLEGHCKFEIFNQPTAPSSVITHPTYSEIKFLTTDLSVSARVSYMSAHSGAITKPLIYVEGFDNGLYGLLYKMGTLLDNSDTTKIKQSICEMLQSGEFDPITNRLTFHSNGVFDYSWFYDSALKYNQSIKDNFDIIYVDWLNPYADIQKNASLLIEIINWINCNIKEEGADRNIIIGHSMGGLITRYALRLMELSENEHQTDVFVSYDAPHLGVNFPIGLQYALRELYHILYDAPHSPGLLTYHLADPFVSYLYNIYNSQSVRQMLYWYVSEDGTPTSSYYNSWQSVFNSIGFPRGDVGNPIENLSISNGGMHGSINQKILDFSVVFNASTPPEEGWLKLLLMMLTRTDNLNISFGVYRYSWPESVVFSATAYYVKHWLWNNELKYKLLLSNNDVSLTKVAPSNYPALDNIYSSYLLEDDVSIDAGPIQFNYFAPILFVPQASSLAISPLNQSDYCCDYYNNPPTPKVQTPFDSFFLNHSANSHETVFPSYWDWIIDQKNLSLVGPENFVLTGDTYSVQGVPSNYTTADWSGSSPSITLTNGIVSVNTSGTMSTVMYKNHFGGAYLFKQKRVLAGFPAMELSANHVNGNQYVVYANCASVDSELRAKVQELSLSGEFKFIWGYKNSDNSYNWCDTTTVNHKSFTVMPGDITHVCMKLYNGPGRESPVNLYTIHRQSNVRYCIDPQEILVNSYSYTMNYQYVTGLSLSKYVAVWCNPDYSGTAIIPDSVVVGGVYYPVVTTLYQTINGDSVIIYCFDINDNPSLQNTIATVRSGNALPNIIYGVSIGIRSNGTTIDNFILPIVSRTLPGPFDPINL